MPTANQIQILKEFTTDKLGIVDFSKLVNTNCNLLFPDAKFNDWGDPAGSAQFSKKEGGFTSNTQLIKEATGIDIRSSEQNFAARKESVEQQLRVIDGILIDPSCIRLINGFIGGYCYQEILHTGIFHEDPLKNRFSHVHDALQYIMVKLVGKQIKEVKPTPKDDYEDDPLRFGMRRRPQTNHYVSMR
jgi:hypothetical protein